jgi:hypothetical protein
MEHIAMMINKDGDWVDVFYNPETKEAVQSQNYGRTVDCVVSEGKDKWDTECYLENEFGSNVELD